MTKRNMVAGVLALVFVAGFGVIVYRERPVMKVDSEQDTTASTTTGSDKNYTMAEIATHNAPANCWSAVNGSVYDLSTWVSRHPGGSGAIEKLCGTDGSEKLNKKHGGWEPAASALALLKIGTLK